MKNIDLEKYKASWKEEKVFREKRLSEIDIRQFMRAASKDVIAHFRKGLLMDLVIKGALFVSLLILIFLLRDQTGWVLASFFLAFLLISGMGGQWLVLQKRPKTRPGEISLLELLRSYLDFYHKHYVPSIFLGASSGSFLFLIGSLFYLNGKYGEIPGFQADDFVVFTMGTVLSFVLGAVVQLKFNNFYISQLEGVLKEIEEDTITPQSLESYRAKSVRRIILISILLIVGLLVFGLLLYSFMS
jgi:hypothetical protein